MRTYHLALDLKEDPDLMKSYVEHHERVWPEIIQSIKESGIERMEIYKVANRLVMRIEVADDFTFENKSKMDSSNPKVQEWEALMETYQSRIPGTPDGSKWVVMDKIFELE